MMLLYQLEKLAAGKRPALIESITNCETSTSLFLLNLDAALYLEGVIMHRCEWARAEPNLTYHDTEWGVPVFDDRVLFEFLTLEGAQAGLSWETILKKREAYREAFAGFDPARVAKFKPAQIARLLKNPAIVRNRLKINSTVGNAKAFLAVQREFGSFD